MDNIKHKDTWVFFMRHIAEWGWPHAFRGLDGECLVVCEEDFLNRLRKLPGNISCALIRRDDFSLAYAEEYKRVLVFIASGEMDLVSDIQKAYPDKLVVSAIHEFSLVNRDRLARLKVVRSTPPECEAGPVVLLSTPNSGAEMLSLLFEENGLLSPWEYIGRPFISLSELYKDIDFFTLVKNAAERYRTADGMSYLFQTDVLKALFDNTNFTQQQFVRWLKDEDARVIVMRNSDSISQAGMSGILMSTYSRSSWTMKTKPTLKGGLKPSQFEACMQALVHLKDGEKLLDDITTELLSVYDIQYEDFARNMEDVFAAVCDYLGYTIHEDFSFKKVKQKQELGQGLRQNCHNFQSELIDRIGLHV